MIKIAKFGGELKAWLLELSSGKCWFSEAKDIYSHWDVEHFRPKKSAKDLNGTEREGYWWLAFEWTNFRICGNVGNRKKGTFFPLLPGSQVASSDNRNIDDELPYLLDPINESDPCMLSFDEEGDAIPMPECKGLIKDRVKESIKRYKLNDHPELLEARRTIWSECRKIINECQKIMKELETKPTATKNERLRSKFKQLHKMVQPSSLLSTTAIQCLNTSGLGWAQKIAVAN